MKEDDYFDKLMQVEDRKDYKEFFRLSLKAATSGMSAAMGVIANMYCNAKYLPKQLNKSIEWDVKAIKADNKDGKSYINLAITYRFKGNLQAYRYFLEKALESGDDEAALELAKLYNINNKEADTVKKLLSIVLNSDNVFDDERKEAEELLNNLNTKKQVNILKDCLVGYSKREKDSKKVLIEDKAKINDELIEGIISYEKGYYRKAYKQFKELAKKYNHADAMNYLGDIYFNGQGVAQSYNKAAKWYHWSVDLGNVEGILKLANLYKDIRKIDLYKYFLEMARHKGSDKATLLLARLYNISEKEIKKVKSLLCEVVNSKTATVDLVYEAEMLLKQFR